MNSYFLKRNDDLRYVGMFSLEELRQGLQAGELNPQWLVAENPLGLSYSQFVKHAQGSWTSLADFHATIPHASSNADEAQGRSATDTPEAGEDAPLSHAEIRAFMLHVRHAQTEQLRLLSAVRWAIVGFSIWFIIQFWILPRLLGP